MEKEEAKQQRSEREMTGGVEGLREVNKAREKSIKAKEAKESDSESGRIVEEKERERGGCHPWLPLITHSLMTQVFFFSPASFPWERGEGVANQTGSFKVHNLQVGRSSTREIFVEKCRDKESF